jgi:hypothetical protein
MRFNTIFIFTALLNACSNTPQRAINDQAISITMTCTDNPTCEFTGSKIPISIAIKNNLSTEIEVPIAFMQKTGPSIQLVDTLSEKVAGLRTNLADFKLLENLTKIQPGQSASINWLISSFELQQFRHEFVDLTAQARFRVKIKNASSNELIEVLAISNSTRIVSKEKPKK